MAPSTWIPLFDGEEAAATYRTVCAIADALGAAEVQRGLDPSLAGGHAGVGVLYAYLARAQPGRGYQAAAAAALDAAMEAVGGSQLSPTFYSGFTGIGWAVEHLRDDIPDIDGETNQGIDEGVLAWMDGGPWNDNYDLVMGLVGLGVYAVERLPHAGGVACLERVIDRLVETADEQADGIAWWTRPELLTLQGRREYPQGWYNVGLAHGLPGVIALLGEAYAAGIARDRVRPLLDGAVRWLLSRKQQDPAGSVFPEAVRRGLAGGRHRSRSAWCYGDPGVAVALLGAARRAGEPSWEAEALAVARQAARRPPEQAGVEDAGICHGAAGLGHLFNRFFQATGDPLFGNAARFWFRRTLDMRQPGQGLAGYQTWGPKPGWRWDQELELAWFDDPGLLTGVAGTALSLLAAVSPIEPRWDRMLLTNL